MNRPLMSRKSPARTGRARAEQTSHPYGLTTWQIADFYLSVSAVGLCGYGMMGVALRWIIWGA